MKHIAVLLHESIDHLNLSSGKTYLDGTLGAGGHVGEAIKRFGNNVRMIALDANPLAIAHAQEKFAGVKNLTLVQSNFRNLDAVCAKLGVTGLDAILFDLGLSSDELETSGRGFSFQHDEPLDMRFDPQQPVSAATIVNIWKEETIADILFAYADERYAKRIAKAIVMAREAEKIETTLDLVDIIRSAVPAAYRNGKTNPATKTFQALRMAVNDEVTAVKEGMEKGWHLLNAGGRFAIISFHSVEDREVKNFFRDKAKAGEGKLILKKPLAPTDGEMKANPRSRSAKLRVIEKLQ